MANARKSTLDVSELRSRALREYAELAQGLSKVAAVAVAPIQPTEVYTYIETADDAICHQLYEIEDKIYETYREQLFGFHIRYLDGRPVDEVVDSSAKLVFNRSAHA